MLALSLGSGSASAVTESEPQNLVFDGATLTWNTNTENKVFTNAAGEAASFATGDNVSFASDATISLGEDISAGQINIASGADVVIELNDNGLNFDTLSMLGGSLDAGPSLNIGAGETLAVGFNGSVLKSALVLEKNASLSVDYSGTGSATSLNDSVLVLQGGSMLQLSGCGNGDGKTYTLFTGVSELRDSQGNAISLEEGDNAISSYFDINQPGSGFWKDAMMVLSDGSLQLVRHNEAVKESVTITTSQKSGADYQYYAGVCIKNIEPSSSSYAAISGGTIMLSDNGSVEFSENSVSSDYHVYGSAIHGSWDSTITLGNNGSVKFIENSASSDTVCAYGGAICGDSPSTIALSGNGSVEFSGNTASGSWSASGGAICAARSSTIILSNNGSVVFEGNTASASYYAEGGAIFAYGNLSIQNNDSVLFEKNAEISDGTYRLRSIYAGGSGYVVSLSAAAGKSIEFRDAVYIASGSTVNLNADYGDTKQQGDIIFTGKYTEQHLNELLEAAGAGRTATAQEILTSRTTEVNTMTNLYGGRLRVEDGAIYQGQGITVHKGSNASVLVKDAVLSHADYELHFYEGTKLEALGASEIFGDVIVESTATAAFSALTRLEGSLTLASGSTLLLEGEFTLDGTLTLGTGLTLGGNVLELLNQLQYGQSLTLVSGLDSLTVQSLNAKSTSEYSAFATDQELRAADYFSNLSPNMVLKYNGEVGSLSVSRVIPEPATSTLSLLALTALVSRRRRK